MKTILATTVLTIALLAGANASADDSGKIVLSNAQLDVVDAGRRGRNINRASSAALATNGFELAVAGSNASSSRTAKTSASASATQYRASAHTSACAGRC